MFDGIKLIRRKYISISEVISLSYTDQESGSRNRVGGVVSKVESTQIVLAPKARVSFVLSAGWIRQFSTLFIDRISNVYVIAEKV